DLKLHYSLMSGLLLAYAALVGSQKLVSIKRLGHFMPGLATGLIVVGFALTWKRAGPYRLLTIPDFYSHSESMQFLQDFTQAIPATGLVMTQNNIAVRLTHTHTVMLLREDYERWQPEIIALDVREGQNPNNYFPIDVFKLKDKLDNDLEYEKVHLTGDQL